MEKVFYEGLDHVDNALHAYDRLPVHLVSKDQRSSRNARREADREFKRNCFKLWEIEQEYCKSVLSGDVWNIDLLRGVYQDLWMDTIKVMTWKYTTPNMTYFTKKYSSLYIAEDKELISSNVPLPCFVNITDNYPLLK
ncbi:MAG: hypothetical protein HRU26_10150 [Psychroserpens sp.]|nr:hypothetical protein [Psychroserpens sp.]